jgi:hypothetical protein
MSQSIERQVSDEDYQLIEANQLGTPQRIYKLKPGPIRLLQGIGLFLLVCGVAVPILLITSGFMGWHKEQADDYLVLAQLVVLSGFSLLAGLFSLRIVVPQARKKHVLVCEHGLLHVEKRIWRKHVQSVHWRDIRAVRKFLGEYAIIYRESEICSLDIMYQNVKELVALIRQRSGVS